MTDWNRKKLVSLGDAVRMRLKSNSISELTRQRLELIAERADHSTWMASGSADLLRDAEAELCNICRDDALYECGQNSGWLRSCTFIESNHP